VEGKLEKAHLTLEGKDHAKGTTDLYASIRIDSPNSAVNRFFHEAMRPVK
jgi:hypothetical protein